MANYRAVVNGNWSSLATWQDDSTGSYVASTVFPGPADVVRTNNFTVTVDISPTVLTVSNGSAASVSAGGTFVLNNGITLTSTTATAGGGGVSLVRPNTTSTSTFVCPTITNPSGNWVTISVLAGSILNIIGDVSGAGTPYRPGPGTINLTGNISQTGISDGYWVDMISGGVMNITGNLATTDRGFWVRGATIINLTGTLTSGPQTAYLNTNQNVTFTHIGPVITGANAAAIVDTFGIYAGTGPFLNNGDFSAVAASRFRLINTGPTYLRTASSVGGVNKFLYTEDNVGGVPSTNDVRDGVVYGIGGGLTGTLIVPSANTVSLGVVYDNGTVGTAQNTASSFLFELSLSTDPFVERLRNVSTVDTTAATVAAFKV